MTVLRKLVPGIAVAGALILAACSSSGGSSPSSNAAASSSPPGSSASSPAPAASAITVGMICSCTGPIAASAAPAKDVAEAWVKSVNAAGGLSGHPVELDFKDDASNPGTAVTAAQQLISDKVDVILDSSQFVATWADAVTKANIPVVGGDLSSDFYFQNPNFYPSGQTNDSIVMSDVLTAKQAGAKKLGQLYCAESPICQQGVAPHKSEGAKLGVPFVYSAAISATAPNYTAQCLAAQQAGVQALFIGDSAQVFAKVASDCHQQGYNPTYIEEGTGFTMQLAQTPALNNHFWADFPIVPFFAHTPAVQKMNAALDKYAPGVRTKADTFSMFAPEAWTAGLLIEKAVAASGASAKTTISPDVIRKGLDSIKNETLGGFSPPLTFTAGKPHSVRCWYTGKIVNGKPVLANGGKTTCAS